MRTLRLLWNRLTRYRYETCERCARRVGPCTGGWWHADDELWIEVTECDDPGPGAIGRRIGPGVLCPPCFTAACDAKGIRIFWHARVEHRDGEDVIEGQKLSGLRPILIARCPEHGLHGERDDCFVCGGPVEQVPVRAVA